MSDISLDFIYTSTIFQVYLRHIISKTQAYPGPIADISQVNPRNISVYLRYHLHISQVYIRYSSGSGHIRLFEPFLFIQSVSEMVISTFTCKRNSVKNIGNTLLIYL